MGSRRNNVDAASAVRSGRALRHRVMASALFVLAASIPPAAAVQPDESGSAEDSAQPTPARRSGSTRPLPNRGGRAPAASPSRSGGPAATPNRPDGPAASPTRPHGPAASPTRTSDRNGDRPDGGRRTIVFTGGAAGSDGWYYAPGTGSGWDGSWCNTGWGWGSNVSFHISGLGWGHRWWGWGSTRFGAGWPWWWRTGPYWDRRPYDWYYPRGPIDGMLLPGYRPSEGQFEPPAPPTPRELAVRALAAGDPERAIAHLRTHLAEYREDRAETDPAEDWEATRDLGIALLAARRWDDAAATVRLAYVSEPNLARWPAGPEAAGGSERRLRDFVGSAVRYAHRSDERAGGSSASAWLLVTVLMQAEGRDEVAARMLDRAEAAGLEAEVVGALRAVLAPAAVGP